MTTAPESRRALHAQPPEVIAGVDATLLEHGAAGRDSAALAAAVQALRQAGASQITWEVLPVESGDDERAQAADLVLLRSILQLERALPAPTAPDGFAVRAFERDADDDAWLRVNNAAFAWHPDQAGWTPQQLAAKQAEPWFRAEDLLVHDAPDGSGLDGFCWTKVHGDPEAGEGAADREGEIFVIAVDPAAHGRGLGRALVLAGLEHLTSQGLTRSMLWVEEDNEPARALYARLGFTVRTTHRWYVSPPPR